MLVLGSPSPYDDFPGTHELPMPETQAKGAQKKASASRTPCDLGRLHRTRTSHEDRKLQELAPTCFRELERRCGVTKLCGHRCSDAGTGELVTQCEQFVVCACHQHSSHSYRLSRVTHTARLNALAVRPRGFPWRDGPTSSLHVRRVT